jgi:hypothetical protein
LTVRLIYVAWLIPAALGAIFDWSLWVIYALLSLGLTWYLVTEGVKYYRKVRRSDPQAPLAKRVPALGALGYWFVVTVWGLTVGESRFCGLLVVLGFILMDLWSYGRWKGRHESVGT